MENHIKATFKITEIGNRNYESTGEFYLGSHKLFDFSFCWDILNDIKGQGAPIFEDFQAWISGEPKNYHNFISGAYGEDTNSESETDFSKLFRKQAWKAWKESIYYQEY